MRLWNYSRFDNLVLGTVIRLAAKASGRIRTTGVVVVVNPARGPYPTPCVQGWAAYMGCGYVDVRGTRVQCGDGHMKLVIAQAFVYHPGYHGYPDLATWALALAERIYLVAAHEWRHIKDHQLYRRGQHLANSTDEARALGRCRRAAWRYRPEEERAIAVADVARERLRSDGEAQDAIIALAIHIEEVLGGQA